MQRGHRALLLEGFEALGSESRYARFFVPKATLGSYDLDQLTPVDRARCEVIGAIGRARDGRVRPYGLAQYSVLAGQPQVAEVAVTIVDALQGKGLGWLLLGRLAALAYERGVRRFRAHVLNDNRPMLRVLARLDPALSIVQRSGGESEWELTLPHTEARHPRARVWSRA